MCAVPESSSLCLIPGLAAALFAAFPNSPSLPLFFCRPLSWLTRSHHVLLTLRLHVLIASRSPCVGTFLFFPFSVVAIRAVSLISVQVQQSTAARMSNCTERGRKMNFVQPPSTVCSVQIKCEKNTAAKYREPLVSAFKQCF